MGKIIFILGGIRSGKSRYAVELAKILKKRTAIITTCINPDKEMKKRIRLHRNSRPRDWKLIEEGRNISSALLKLQDRCEVVLIDCLGLWISNFLLDKLEDKEIEKKAKKLLDTMLKVKFTTILVSNEVGSSMVAVNLLARRFQDLIGFTNQMVSRFADKVIFMQAGIPLEIQSAVGGQKSKF